MISKEQTKQVFRLTLTDLEKLSLLFQVKDELLEEVKIAVTLNENISTTIYNYKMKIVSC